MLGPVHFGVSGTYNVIVVMATGFT